MQKRQSGFCEYYGLVLRQIGRDIKGHIVTTLFALLGVVAVVVLQEKYKLITPDQTWPRAVINATPSIALLLSYVLYYALRSPCQVYNALHEERDKELDKVLTSQNELRQQFESEYQEAKVALRSLQEQLAASSEDNRLEIDLWREKAKDLETKIGRPYVTLTFKDVDFIHEPDEPGVQCEDRTEFIATCSAKDAFGVFIRPVRIGSITLHGRIEVEKIPCGESRKLEYILLNYDRTYRTDVVNLQFWGRLRELFDKTLRDTEETQLNIPISIYYRDVSGCGYETNMNLFYHPQIYGTPIMSVLNITQQAGPDAQRA